MILFYNIGIWLFDLSLLIISPFHKKAGLLRQGRKNTLSQIKKGDIGKETVWIHCSSLGEFEQGRTVIEAIKKDFPEIFICLTFFSPSGFEAKKYYHQADWIGYLPSDRSAYAKQFIRWSNPRLVIFVKYEFWHHYAQTLKNHNIPILSISCIFRPDQIFFKPFGNFFRNILQNFQHFFVQNEQSISLLNQIGIQACTLTGDTRFDRVFEVARQKKSIPAVERFTSSKKTLVIGSSWPEDLDILIPFIHFFQDQLKFLIAPHEISENELVKIEKLLIAPCIRFSKVSPEQDLNSYTVLIIDNIGMLSSLYGYGQFAYVGGGFGKGLHNILEPACFGIPIFFGNKNYKKFKEANDLIQRGGAFEVGDYNQLKSKFEWLSEPENYELSKTISKVYVEDNIGATKKIMQFCSKILSDPNFHEIKI